jgi:hypothetical protein
MNIVNPNLPVNLFIQPSSQSVLPVDLHQLELRLDQVVLARVIEGGMDKALLELNDQNYRAQSEKELQVGQQLRLQVMQVQPRLEFRVLTEMTGNRLVNLLPLLTHSYDWSDLTGRLQHHPNQEIQAQTLSNVFSKIQQLLNSPSDVEVLAEKNIVKILNQWQQLTSSSSRTIDAANVDLLRPPTSQGVFSDFSSLAISPVDKVMIELVQKLQSQIALLRNTPERMPVSPQWLEQTRELLKPLQQDNLVLQNFPPTTRSLLIDNLTQLRVQPKATPQLMAAVQKILIQLKGEGSAPSVVSGTEVRQGPKLPVDMSVIQPFRGHAYKFQDSTSNHPAHRRSTDPPFAGNLTPPVGGRQDQGKGVEVIPPHATTGIVIGPSESSTVPQVNHRMDMSQLEGELKQLVTLVQQAQGQKTGLSPSLFGRLEGLLNRLQQSATHNPVVTPDFNNVISQLSQFLTQQPGVPQGGHLGLLSQLFGFYLETELLQGKQKEALASLKLSLLNLQKELGEDVTEPLRRLELFQLCKARLGEDQIQFLPLPFSELEEGYLLAENQASENDGEEKKGLNLSVSLRLSALGNVRIDMLYSPEHGLQMQVAGENSEKKRYLESCADELRQSIQTVALNTVSFSADAQLPARQLQKRLMPELDRMLDARI